MLLEEASLLNWIHPVNISAGDQFKPEFLAISPNNRMPAIIDDAPAGGGDAVSVFESRAIRLYLAEKTVRFLPQDLRGLKSALEWLFWQMGGLGPMAGQNHHFGIYAPEKIPYAITRYVNETNRLYGVLIAAWQGTAIWRGTITALPTWRPIPGSCRGSSRTWTASCTCERGSMVSGRAPPRCGPTRRASRSPRSLL
jgi:GST-like protein